MKFPSHEMQVTQLKVPRFVLKAASESKPPDHATDSRAINYFQLFFFRNSTPYIAQTYLNL